MSRILVVDDNPSLLSALGRILESFGHSVILAGDGQEALGMLGTGPLDLVITDVYMPDMDGIEFLVHLREHCPEVPVVAMSGGGVAPQEFVLEDARQLGAAAILEKPFEVDEVEAVIQQALGGEGGGAEISKE